MAGKPYLMRVIGFALRAPRTTVPGLDVAGTVVAAGSAVTWFSIGDEVFGISRGSFAELAAVAEEKLSLKPATCRSNGPPSCRSPQAPRFRHG